MLEWWHDISIRTPKLVFVSCTAWSQDEFGSDRKNIVLSQQIRVINKVIKSPVYGTQLIDKMGNYWKPNQLTPMPYPILEQFIANVQKFKETRYRNNNWEMFAVDPERCEKNGLMFEYLYRGIYQHILILNQYTQNEGAVVLWKNKGQYLDTNTLKTYLPYRNGIGLMEDEEVCFYVLFSALINNSYLKRNTIDRLTKQYLDNYNDLFYLKWNVTHREETRINFNTLLDRRMALTVCLELQNHLWAIIASSLEKVIPS